MSEYVKVQLAVAETEGDKFLLSLRTVEGLDVRFELDHVALALLRLTLPGVADFAAGQPPRQFSTHSWIED